MYFHSSTNFAMADQPVLGVLVQVSPFYPMVWVPSEMAASIGFSFFRGFCYHCRCRASSLRVDPRFLVPDQNPR